MWRSPECEPEHQKLHFIFYMSDSVFNKQILKCFLVFTYKLSLATNKIHINISQTQQSRCNKRTQSNQSSVSDVWCGIAREYG